MGQARRWKSQFTSEQLEEMKARIAEIPGVFERVAQEYEHAAPQT